MAMISSFVPVSSPEPASRPGHLEIARELLDGATRLGMR